MNRLSRWGIWALPGWNSQHVDVFAENGAKWFAVLRGEWDAALRYAGDFENILLRIMDRWGRWDSIKLSAPEYHHMEFIWSKDNFKIEDLAQECRDKGSKLWIAGDFIPHLQNEDGTPSETKCREYARFERIRAVGFTKVGDEVHVGKVPGGEYKPGILTREGLEDVGIVGLNLARGTYNADGVQYEWFEEFTSLIDEYPERVLIGLQDLYASVWPWAWMGPDNQGDTPNANPFPNVSDPGETIPAYLLGAFQEFVPVEHYPFILSSEAGWDQSLPPMPYTERGWTEARKEWEKDWPGEYPGHIAALVQLMRWMDDFALAYGLAGLIYYSATGAGAENEWPDMVFNDSARFAVADYITSRGEGESEPPDPPDPPSNGEPSEDVIVDLQAARHLVNNFGLEIESTDGSVLVHIRGQKQATLDLLDGVLLALQDMVDDLL